MEEGVYGLFSAPELVKYFMKKKIIALMLLIILASCTATSHVVKEQEGTIEAFFCPRDQCLEKMLALIGSADEVKCAFYDLDLKPLIGLLEEKNAAVLLEDGNALEQFSTGDSPGLMHNKFCVLDHVRVITGSMNPTERGNYYNNNNLLIIQSPHIAENYLAEFEELRAQEFGKGKKVAYPLVKLKQGTVENYFCPEDKCKLHVIRALQKANESIYFMLFTITDEDIGNLLYNKNELGVKVKGLLEAKEISPSSRFKDLESFSKLDTNPYNLHHKVFIVDNKTVITGSYNPTKNGNERNDENILVIHSAGIAKAYREEFESLWQQEQSLPESTSEIIISKVYYDAIGKDAVEEFVEITNLEHVSVNLNYYFLSNNKSTMRLKGKIEPDASLRIKPSFPLPNTKGRLLLKRNYDIIDFVSWEDAWNLKARTGEVLVRRDNSHVSKEAWQVTVISDI